MKAVRLEYISMNYLRVTVGKLRQHPTATTIILFTIAIIANFHPFFTEKGATTAYLFYLSSIFIGALTSGMPIIRGIPDYISRPVSLIGGKYATCSICVPVYVFEISGLLLYIGFLCFPSVREDICEIFDCIVRDFRIDDIWNYVKNRLLCDYTIETELIFLNFPDFVVRVLVLLFVLIVASTLTNDDEYGLQKIKQASFVQFGFI